jgi:hypothetical protein
MWAHFTKLDLGGTGWDVMNRIDLAEDRASGTLL